MYTLCVSGWRCWPPYRLYSRYLPHLYVFLAFLFQIPNDELDDEMEAIPKLPMLSFQAKTSPENIDFSAKLRQIIAEKFGENPAGFAEEIKEIESLR